LLLFCATQAGHAAHPLITDDTGTQDKGHYQIETNTDRAMHDGITTHVGAFSYTAGLLTNLDIFVNAPISFSAPARINDISLGAKWRLFEAGAASIALKPELLLPTGDQNKGLGNGLASVALTMIGSYDAAPWFLHGNLWLARNRFALQADREANRRSLWRVSAAAWYAISEQTKLVLDAGIDRNWDKQSEANPAYVLAGVIYSPITSVDIDAGVKFGLGCNSCNNKIGHQAGIGLTWRF
jgi:hypothetical protein